MPSTNATRVSDLKPYLKYQAAIDKLYSVFGLLEDYLIGYWSDGEYYFRMNSDFSTEYDIPWLDGPEDYWELDGNIYLSGGTECFRFDVIDWNSYRDICLCQRKNLLFLSPIKFP